MDQSNFKMEECTVHKCVVTALLNKRNVCSIRLLALLSANLQATTGIRIFFTIFLLEINVHLKFKDRMSNSVDPDETAHNEPSPLELRCL